MRQLLEERDIFQPTLSIIILWFTTTQVTKHKVAHVTLRSLEVIELYTCKILDNV